MMDVATHVLVIEDDAEMCRVLTFLLRGEGYSVVEAHTGRDGVELAERQAPHVILLDLGLPDLDGSEIVQQLGQSGRRPLIVISAREQEHQKVLALDRGATDYVTKPFGAGELLARIRAGLRRVERGRADEDVFKIRELIVDLASEKVTLRDSAVPLSPTEYRLLRALIRARGTVLTHRQLLTTVWGAGAVDEIHYLRVYIKRLRSKLEDNPTQPRYIVTEPNLGYRFGAS